MSPLNIGLYLIRKLGTLCKPNIIFSSFFSFSWYKETIKESVYTFY